MVTRNGIALVMLSASAFVLGRLFGLLELHVLGAGLLALIAVALVTVATRPLALTIERHVDPLRPGVGDTARVRVGVTTAHRSPLVELWEPVGDGTGAALHLAPLRRGRRVEAVYLLPTTRRGIVRVGPMSAHIGDPFGLVARHRYVAAAAEVVVRPRTIALAVPDLTARGGRLTRRLAERALTAPAAEEFHGLRDYVPGDDLRRVHWAATARHGELLVRQHDARASLHVVVVLDLAATSYGGPHDAASADAGFELAVSTVASLALAADPERPAMTLVTSDSEGLPLDASGIDATLERLAVIDTSTSTITPSVPRPPSSLVLAVVVTGASGIDRAHRLAVAAGPVDATVVVACGGRGSSTGARRNGAFVLAPGDLDDLAAEWTSLVGRTGTR